MDTGVFKKSNPYAELADGSASASTAQQDIPNVTFPNSTSVDSVSSKDCIVTDLPEDGPVSQWAGFSDTVIRQVFIRKVYTILTVQLTFTFAMIALFLYEHHVQKFVRQNQWMYFSAYILFFVVYLALSCSPDLRRKHPHNFVLLGIFTVSLSYMTACIASYNDLEVVLMAVGITAACCLGVTLFATTTKHDLTSWAGTLFILTWVLLLFGILAIMFWSRVMYLIYASCGAFLFMLFLAYDTQMLIGGKKHSLSPEEHIFAALNLYLDVIYIFLFILTIFGGGRK